jgi:hypothetical protein
VEADLKSRHLLAAVPLAAATLIALGAFLLAESPALPSFYRFELATVEASGFVGCLVAGRQFEAGHFLRRAWFLIGACYALIFVGDLTLTTGVFSQYPWTPLANGILTIVANASQIAGTWMLARAWRVAGLTLPGSRRAQIGVYAAAFALAVVAAGTSLPSYVRAIARGEIGQNLMWLASSVGDIVSFSLIAPMLLTALALRGGMLSWPWAFFTASLLSWLGVDAVVYFGPSIHLSDAHAKLALEIFRGMACTFGMSAGFAQRLVSRGGQSRPR